MTLQIRRAAHDDAAAAACLLADAFADYPWTRWTVAAADHVDRLRRLYHLLLTAVALPYGRVDLGHAEGGLVAVAVWLRSDAVPEEVWARTTPAVRRLAGDRAAAADDADTALGPERPAGVHIALAAIGVCGHRRGRGFGSGLLEAGLRRADRSGLPVHLETSDERNTCLYRRLGFDVTAVVDLPDGGPRTWLMHRPGPTDRRGTAPAVRSRPPTADGDRRPAAPR